MKVKDEEGSLKEISKIGVLGQLAHNFRILQGLQENLRTRFVVTSQWLLIRNRDDTYDIVNNEIYLNLFLVY